APWLWFPLTSRLGQKLVVQRGNDQEHAAVLRRLDAVRAAETGSMVIAGPHPRVADEEVALDDIALLGRGMAVTRIGGARGHADQHRRTIVRGIDEQLACLDPLGAGRLPEGVLREGEGEIPSGPAGRPCLPR